MKGSAMFAVAALVLQAVLYHAVVSLNSNSSEIQQFLDEYEALAVELNYNASVAWWNYETNITDYNEKKGGEIDLVVAKYAKEMAKRAATFDVSGESASIQRQFRFIKDIGTAAETNLTKVERLVEVSSKLPSLYSKAKVSLPNKENLSLEPDLTRIMASSMNYTELTMVWKRWRDASGKKMRALYEEYVELSNDAVKYLDYKDAGEYWRSPYETPTFEEDVKRLYEEVSPLYKKLHAYVRKKLKSAFGAEHFPASGHIPAHLLGNMWGQTWEERIDLLKPFADKSSLDMTDELRAQNYTVEKMFRTSENFYKSLGLKGMPDSFWNNSMLVRPADGREVVCHASAWDFSKNSDVRIKQCTDITQTDFMTIHHEMGHVEYYLQYEDQLVLFRAGANPGFHEAVGDVMTLSVQTPEHLHTIGLLKELTNDTETDLNFLMNMALQKVAFLPFGYLIDQWRWSVFSGATPPAHYNRDWWQLRCQYQGLSAPVKRDESDFDPGAKYHVASGTPYIRYFVSFILQFQFHKAACEAAGYKGPLHRCDIYNKKQAGELFHNMLKMGSSVPWQEQLKNMTGQPKMSGEALKEFFKPLMEFLDQETKGEELGWSAECPMDIEAEEFAANYNEQAMHIKNEVTEAEWNQRTNVTDHNQEVMNEAHVKKALFKQEAFKNASRFDNATHLHHDLRRQLDKIKDIGPAALPDKQKLKQLQDAISSMESIYAEAKPCLSNGQCLLIEPGLVKLLATSDDYDLLLSAWQKWRDETGPKMKELFQQYVQLSNEGVQQLGFSDYGAYWRSWYATEDPSYDFKGDMLRLWDQVKPLYRQLHAYVRRHLKVKYGADKMPGTGHIPAHLLGNMWSQHWNNIFDDLKPFKNKQAIDITQEMIKQNYTALRIFKKAEDFFTSIGMENMTQTFWNKSMITKPTDGRNVVCHGSAEDFYKKDDFRIKMCTEVNQEYFNTVHHEMGHIEYFMLYSDLPVVYRDSANPGFHEAVGDLMSLSVQTPEHLQKVHLLHSYTEDEETDLNFQMNMALQKVAFLPFGYLMDQWRWGVFSGETKPDHYNTAWWDLRCSLQGIAPPVLRKATDFDPGAKYHIPADVPYIRYFVSFILQFQFHKAACDAANYTGSLHHCDIYRSTQAGEKIRSMLELGASKPWPDALELLTGSRQIDASALLEYFRPLYEYLQKQNGDDVGWKEDCPNMAPEGPTDGGNGGAGTQSVSKSSVFLSMAALAALVGITVYQL